MLPCRTFVVRVSIAGLLTLLGPSAALAAGPSAGDQQYVDPLAHSHQGTTTASAPPAPQSEPPAAPAPAAGTTSSGAAPAVVTSPTTITSSPPTGTVTDPSSSSSTLPYTGFNAWVGAALGLGLVACGLIIRRTHARRS